MKKRPRLATGESDRVLIAAEVSMDAETEQDRAAVLLMTSEQLARLRGELSQALVLGEQAGV